MAITRRQQSGGNAGMKSNAGQNKRANVGNANVVKKPLPDPTTVKHVFVMVIMHICRRVILFQPELKVTLYLAALVFGSLVSDFLPIPRSYFSRKSNFLNQWFVKWSWAWTLAIVGLYVGLTCWVYCCGNVNKVRNHLSRLLVGTISWFCWTKLFVFIENLTASCMNDKFTNKLACNKHGHAWIGFDISGHAFILIYCSLLIAEEAKSIRGWERIGDLIRNEQYDEDSPLKPLSSDELNNLKEYYEKLTPYVRLIFIILTLLSILWDVMLVATILYFHHMVQKVVGGCIAVCMWFVTYRGFYTLLPGHGPFKYGDVPPPRQRRSSISSITSLLIQNQFPT